MRFKLPSRPRLPRLRRRGPADGEQGKAEGENGAAAWTAPTPTAPSADAPSAGAQTATTPTADAASAAGGGRSRFRLPRPEIRKPTIAAPRLPKPSGRTLRFGAGAAALLAAGGGGFALSELTSDDERQVAPAPTVIVREAPAPEATEEIGFPAFATRNTTRVAGADPTVDAAGVALASYPSIGGVGGPKAVILAEAENWQAAIAASSLAAEPIEAPILLGSPDAVPDITAQALAGLSPGGIKRADGVQVIAVGDVAVPEGLETLRIEGAGPAELAKGVDRQRARLSGKSNPDHIVVVPLNKPAIAMPAAAWAARSGDPIVFSGEKRLPKFSREVLERHPRSSVYVLGPTSAIGNEVIEQLEQTRGRAIRIGDADPVVNAIEFARFSDGSFGWDINDPGHGFTIANTSRPADAAASAPLATGGKPGPLLVTNQADEPPRALRNFLLDTKPGYSLDPTRAVYNHIWLMGDAEAISVAFQAQVEELTRLQEISRGSGVPSFGPDPGKPEAEAGRGGSGSGGAAP